MRKPSIRWKVKNIWLWLLIMHSASYDNRAVLQWLKHREPYSEWLNSA